MGMKRRLQYESPLTRRTRVEVEAGFMKASVTYQEKDKGVRVEEHEVNTGFDYTLTTEGDNANTWKQ